jgi:DNA-binding NtrC family response regulator
MPALRERGDDIPILVKYLVNRYAEKAGKSIRHINKRTLDLFQAYDWPGNVRELQNVIERTVIFCDGETFAVDDTWLTPVVAPHSVATRSPLVADLVEHERATAKSSCPRSGAWGSPASFALTASKPRPLRIRATRG